MVEEGGKRIAKSFRIRAKDPDAAKADAMLLDLKDSHWLNRKYAAEVLGELREPRAVRPLVDALADEVGDVRQRAYDSLIKIGGVAVPTLVPLLVSEEDELRQSATEIIRKIGKPAVEPLATALAEADDRLKTRVLKVLDRMGYKPKAKEAVKEELPRLTQSTQLVRVFGSDARRRRDENRRTSRGLIRRRCAGRPGEVGASTS